MKTTSVKRFTLIELLMVISIIAILMGILLPTISHVKRKAKVVKAQSEIGALKTAVLMYESTYGYLPFLSTNDGLQLTATTYGLLIDYLQNDSTRGNPRGIRMLEVDTKQGIGNFDDPWHNRYNVALDTNYDGDIPITAGPYEVVYASVAVWSRGPDGTSHGGEGKPNHDDVSSWR